LFCTAAVKINAFCVQLCGSNMTDKQMFLVPSLIHDHSLIFNPCALTRAYGTVVHCVAMFASYTWAWFIFDLFILVLKWDVFWEISTLLSALCRISYTIIITQAWFVVDSLSWKSTATAQRYISYMCCVLFTVGHMDVVWMWSASVPNYEPFSFLPSI